MADRGVGGVHHGFELLDELDHAGAALGGVAVLLVHRVVDRRLLRVATRHRATYRHGEQRRLALQAHPSPHVELLARAVPPGVAVRHGVGENLAQGHRPPRRDLQVAVEHRADVADHHLSETQRRRANHLAVAGVEADFPPDLALRERGLAVAPRDDRGRARGRVPLVDDRLVDRPETLADRPVRHDDPLAAHRLCEGERAAVNAEDILRKLERAGYSSQSNSAWSDNSGGYLKCWRISSIEA